VQYILLPPECRGVSKIRHLKIDWRTHPTPSFYAEVVGRCNGACILGTLYKEGGSIPLPEETISTISVGLSLYVFFAPAVRVFNTKTPTQADGILESAEGDDQSKVTDTDSAAKLTTASVPVKRFPKVWSKAITDVFISMSVYEISKPALIERFKSLHAAAVISHFGESNPELETELWSNLKRFIAKSPFEFDPDTNIVRFDPLAIKPKPQPKKPRVGGSEDGDGTNEGIIVE
jgi:hypothetical protein